VARPTTQQCPGNPYGDAGSTLVDLERDPHVGSITAANLRTFVTLGSGAHSVGANMFVTQAIRGSVHPTVVQGRWPASSSEIAVGATTLRAIGAAVGSTISVSAGHRTTHLRVVGRVVLPDFGFGSALGKGAGLTLDGLRRLVPGAQATAYGFDFRPGTDVPAEIRHLNRELPGSASSTGSAVLSPRIGDQLDNLSKIQGLLLAMTGLIALTALAALTNLLVTSVRRRRRDLAILKTLGFVRRQVRSTVAWQASCVAAVSLVIGVPIGLAAGRWAWDAFANNVGVVPEPAIPLVAALLVVPITIVAANLAAALPARAAGRVLSASVLRTE
jgi:FtsX-like permease family